MSQSRNCARRATSRGRDPGPGAHPARPADSPRDFMTENNQNHVNKRTNKIPKELRYDLENALLGLCDVWFDEIKPHLVKNKLKVHTGGALQENGHGDLGAARQQGRGPSPRAAARRQLDPVSVETGDLRFLLANAARSIEDAVLQAASGFPPDAAQSRRIS